MNWSDPVTETRKLKLPILKRAMQAPMSSVADTGEIEFPFSSEMPVERWFGDEVLSHNADSVDLSRLNDAAPLLWNHDPNQMIGVVESAKVGPDKRAYATARFGSSPLAQQVKADVEAGVIRNVSVGYRINRMIEDYADGRSTFTATDWQPFEVSLVAIPADPGVGLGRSDNDTENREITVEVRGQPTKGKDMLDAASPPPAVPAAPAVDVSAIRAEATREAITSERSRIASIEALGGKFEKPELARQLIDSGKSIEEARGAFLEALGAKQKPIADGETGKVDMTDKEQRSYSLVRAINAAISKDWSKAGLELEVSRTLAKESGRETEGFFMPLNLSMDTRAIEANRAAYAVGAAGTGGDLVATNLMAGSFIEVLRNRAMIMSLGPTIMSGLVGNVAIPRQITQTATYWVTEGTAITEAEATFDQVTLSPKQLGARSQYSRLALQQTTPDIEAVVRSDLARVMALGIDLAAIVGSGASGQPTGILNQSGIGSGAMGTNGAAFASSSTTAGTGLDQIMDLEAKVDIANALNGTLYYLTNAKVVADLKKLKDQQGRNVWTSDRDDTTAGTQGEVNGYGVARSNQVPSTLTKGTGTNLSALLFGDFSQLVIGMWGGLEVLPNPYGSGYTAGAVDIRAMQTCDIAVRHAASFAAITDIVTTL